MEIKEDRCGNITLELKNNDKKFYLHSKYDVYKDARRFALKFEKKSKNTNILYGFGLGYHIKEILKILKSNQKLYILDLRKDIFNLAKEKIDIKEILDDERIVLIIEDDYKVLAKKLLNYSDLQQGEFFIYEPCVNAIENKNLEFKNFFDNLKIQKSMFLDEKQQKYIKENLEFNSKLNDKNADIYFGKFEDTPGIIVSAGPSLDYVLPKLKKFKDKSLIFSVGRALRSFKRYDFEPDMFMIIDSNPIMRLQIEGFENSNIPFMYLITANKDVVDAYKGPRLVFFNDEKYSKENDIIQTDGSVATGVLDMMIKMGCNPIIFVGQDLGFYKEGTHSKDSLYYQSENTKDYSNYEIIKNVFSEDMYTTKGFLNCKRFIEIKIKENKDIKFINSSYKGAKIKGAEFMDIEDVYRLYIENKSDIDMKNKIHSYLGINKNI